MHHLGTRIRQIRKRCSLTLKNLSDMTGLSVGFLSEIERDLAQPSMVSLRKIREALGVSLVTFLNENEPAEKPNGLVSLPAAAGARGRPYIRDARMVKAGERKKLAYPNQDGFYELMTPDLNRQLEVLFFRMEAGFDTGPEPFVDPPGEKCMVILKGGAVFRVGDDAFELNAGDSLSYPADSPVSWIVTGDEPVEGILIITPPGF